MTTAGASSTSGAADTPKVLISYAYEGSEVEDWVVGLASRLRGDGIETLLDRWAVRPGYDLTYFMESAIRESNNVLIVCTPTYKKADERAGGVGYESAVMTGEQFGKVSEKGKFIPVLCPGEQATAIPSWLLGRK